MGAKATLAGGALQLTAAAYQIDWKDILVRVGLPCGLNPFLNAGGGESKGFELEFNAVPVEGLQFYGGVAYADATITEGAFLVGALDGESMPNVPKLSFSLGGRYSFPLGDRLNAFIGTNVQYVDDTESNFSQIGSILLDSYTLVRASAGVSWDRWALEVFADNITDSRAALAAAFGVATDSLMRTRPRTFGLTLRGRF